MLLSPILEQRVCRPNDFLFVISESIVAVAIQNTTFGGIQGFTRKPSTPWKTDSGKFAGVVHQERGWTYALLYGAGHLVPRDDPELVCCYFSHPLFYLFYSVNPFRPSFFCVNLCWVITNLVRLYHRNQASRPLSEERIPSLRECCGGKMAFIMAKGQRSQRTFFHKQLETLGRHLTPRTNPTPLVDSDVNDTTDSCI